MYELIDQFIYYRNHHVKANQNTFQKNWKKGNRSDELMRDNRKILKRLVNSTNRAPEEFSCNFSKLMWQSKVRAALKLLNSDYDNGALKVDDNTFKDLQEKHPKPA